MTIKAIGVLSDGGTLNFNGIVVTIKEDPSIGNTKRYCTEAIQFQGELFSGAEIIMLQKILQSFFGNKITKNKVYKITKTVSAMMVEKSGGYMLSISAHGDEIAIFDKVYAGYWNGVIQAILFKLPIFIFYKNPK